MVAQASGSRRNQVGGSGPRRCSHRLRLVETSEGVVQDQRIPVFHQSGWFDGDGIGSKLNYARMVALGHPNQKLVLGPWGHTDVATRSHGQRRVPMIPEPCSSRVTNVGAETSALRRFGNNPFVYRPLQQI